MKKQCKNKGFTRVGLLRACLFLGATIALIAGGKALLNAAYVPVIVMYHSVGEEGKTLKGYGGKLNVKGETFAKQMKFLHEKSYRVIPLEDFIEMVKKGERIQRKTVAITFDDGLRNNFLHAYPVLKKYGFPATIFVATDLVGKKDFLTWDEIKIMQKNGISMGSHTLSHAWLPDLDKENLQMELTGSRKILEEKTGQKVKTLSYPLGAFNRDVKKAAREAGYIGAVATNPGKKYPNNDPYALKRIRISMSSDNLAVFWVETSGYYTFIKEMRDSD